MVPTLQLGKDFFLLEDWEQSPAGPYRAVFHFTPDGVRTLYIDSEAAVDVISSIHRFDVIRVVDVVSERGDGRWVTEVKTGLKEGGLRLEVDYEEAGALTVANAVASHTPEAVTRSSLFCRLMPRVAALVLGTDSGQKMAGTTETGTRCRFRVERLFRVVRARGTVGGKDAGEFVDCTLAHDLGDFSPVSKAVVSKVELYFEPPAVGPSGS